MPGSVINTKNDDYEFAGHHLGDGTFGKVMEAKSKKRGEKVAVKMITRKRINTPKDEEMLMYEVKMMKQLDSPFIIKFFEFYEDDKFYYLIMERMKTDLFEEIQAHTRLSERSARFVMYQACNGVKYLHDKDIAHCDLKPENILISHVKSENELLHAKLCDFGFSRHISKLEKRKSNKGTTYYMAPELLQSELHDRSIDIWGLGVIFYVALNGEFPFKGKYMPPTDADILKDLKEKLSEDNKENFYASVPSKEAQEFLKSTIIAEPKRPNIDQLLKLNYFKNSELQQDINKYLKST